MGMYRRKIDEIVEKLERLPNKFVRDPALKQEAKEACEVMGPCVKTMDAILEEVERTGKEINTVMNQEEFRIDPEATVEAFKVYEDAMDRSTAPEVVKEQAVIQRDKLRDVLDELLEKLDKIDQRQQAGKDAP